MEDIDRELFDSTLDLLKHKVYVRDHSSWLDLDDLEFSKRFRLNKSTFLHLLSLIEADLTPKNNRGLPMKASDKLALFLRIVATNNFQLSAADEFGVNQATASRAFHEVLEILFAMKEKFIFWPEKEEEKRISQRFYVRTGIPGLVGALDGSLVRIQAPSVNEHEYVCRKGFHAINFSAVVDDRFLFRWVVAEHPGSAADCRIFNESILKTKLESKEYGGTLLGDSGYRPSDVMLTPILNPVNQKERRYTDAVCRGRVVVEQGFGHLKRQFACLHSGLRYDPITCCKVIIVCCVLRNIANIAGDPLFEGDNDDLLADVLAQDPIVSNVQFDGRGALQAHVVNNFF